ncbi:MAG TPA: histidine kinase [Holophagaceae bacterium]|nr:histidine kinase [Holophagaceae bacterium]
MIPAPTRFQRAFFAASPWLVLVFALEALPGFGPWLERGSLTSFITGFLPGAGIAGLWLAGFAVREPGFPGWVRSFAMGVSLSEGVRIANGLLFFGSLDRAPRTWSGFAVFLALSLVAASLLHRLAFHRAESERQRGLAEEARQQSLRARLAPHFLFNTLNTLKALMAQDPARAEALVDQLGVLFRQVLVHAEAPSIPLREELAFVEAYLGIEQARLGDRLQVRIEVPEALEACEVPPLSLQVLVENAVKHGLGALERGGEIRLRAAMEGPDLLLEVSDPGPGPGAAPDSAPGAGGSGTALETLRARLAAPGDLTLARAEDRTVATFRWRQL